MDFAKPKASRRTKKRKRFTEIKKIYKIYEISQGGTPSRRTKDQENNNETNQNIKNKCFTS